jgi:hypothetical protein
MGLVAATTTDGWMGVVVGASLIAFVTAVGLCVARPRTGPQMRTPEPVAKEMRTPVR